jgi:L-ascorbate metabolism protein UlaG (beta-lactamase superfamily)
MADINKIKSNNTIIVAPSCVTKSIDKNKRIVKAGDVIKVKGIKIQVVPSYNLNIDNHAKQKGYVGFIVTMDGVSYYHPGDTDVIPEMKKVKADVAFLPVCGTYMMSAEDAVKAANIIKPKVVIPFHWGSVFGTKADTEKFKSLYSGHIVILEN